MLFRCPCNSCGTIKKIEKMAVLYRISKLSREFADGRQDPANGKWFAKAVHLGTVDERTLAKDIAYSCTCTEADVLAVIQALIVEINTFISDSFAVKVDGLGIFRGAISSTGAVEASEFSVSKNITGVRVNFMEARTQNLMTGKFRRAISEGCRFMETPKNDVLSSGGGTSDGGGA